MTELAKITEALYSAFWDGEPKASAELAVLVAATKTIDSVAWHKVAEECLRQMHWARNNRPDAPITAAPDDWKLP